jgi:hypothetical protein
MNRKCLSYQVEIARRGAGGDGPGPNRATVGGAGLVVVNPERRRGGQGVGWQFESDTDRACGVPVASEPGNVAPTSNHVSCQQGGRVPASRVVEPMAPGQRGVDPRGERITR